MNLEALKAQLIQDEGIRLKPYIDTVGKNSIGIGRNLDDVGISQDEAVMLLSNDIRRAYDNLIKALPWALKLDDVRQNVLINMTFNLGIGGLLQFKNFLAHLQIGDYNQAASAGLQSKWARQVGRRANRLMDQIRSGE